MVLVHADVTADSYAGNDRRLVAFLERRDSDSRAWDVHECRNRECGCGCRHYLPTSTPEHRE